MFIFFIKKDGVINHNFILYKNLFYVYEMLIKQIIYKQLVLFHDIFITNYTNYTITFL